MLDTLDFTIRIGSTPTFLYFDLYLYSAYAAHYVYFFTTYVFPENKEIVKHVMNDTKLFYNTYLSARIY